MTGSGNEDLFPPPRLNRLLSVQLRDLRGDVQQRATRTGFGRSHLRGEFPRVLIRVLLGAQPAGGAHAVIVGITSRRVNFMFKLQEAENQIIIDYEVLSRSYRGERTVFCNRIPDVV
jgi:hypothetical protein